MNFLRSDEFKDAMHSTNLLFQPSQTTFEMTAAQTIAPLLEAIRGHPHADVSNGLIDQTHLLPWLQRQTHFKGSRSLVAEMIQLPLTSVDQVKMRQDWIRRQPNVGKALAEIATYEDDVLWALRLPSIKDTWPMPMLFPCWPIIRLMNQIPWVIEFYQVYRLYLAPAMNLVYPASVFFGPWWYLNYKLKWNLPLKTYVMFLTKILRELFRIDRANLRQSVLRVITFAAYILIYVYTIVQSIDIAVMLHRVRRQLQTKMASIGNFVQKAERIVASCPDAFFEHFGVHVTPQASRPSFANHMTSMYKLWTSESHRAYLAELLQKVYVLDTISMARSWIETNKWTFAACDANRPLTLRHMKNPVLPAQQQSNPLKLSKNLVITGPNAAGKTTYVKSILCNILLSQTFGMAYASACSTPVFHTISSFMRIHDEVGRESLFEAEVRRCLEAIRMLQERQDPVAAPESRSPPPPAIVLLDEPMHSTPPVEGTASAMAFIKQVAEIPGVRCITTTHFFPITSLAKECPGQFVNLSFEAQLARPDIKFSYRLRPGPSFQCIALDLLRQKGFPQPFILDAIKFKNKICPELSND